MAGRKLVSVRLSEAAPMYYAYMESCNLAPNTVATARSALRGLEHVIGNKLLQNIDWQDVSKYFTARNQEPIRAGQLPRLCQSTVNLQLHRLGAFFDWAVKFRYMDPSNDPMHGRKTVKITPEKRARVEAHEFRSLLDAAPNPRDRMVLALGLYTMLRGGEIRPLRIGDMALSDSLLQVVRYKTHERDELAICTELRLELANYLAWYSGNVQVTLENDFYLVPTNERRKPTLDTASMRFVPADPMAIKLVPTKPLYPQASSQIVQRALRAIGWDVTAKEGGHTLRRSAARELFESLRGGGFDDALMVVMSWLGHKQPLVTMRYLGLDKEAERRNKLYKDSIMYPRVTMDAVADQALKVVVGG